MIGQSRADAAGGRGAAVAVERLCKRLGSKDVLRDIELDVRAGEFLTLLGPSGSGKTTLLMAIAGFVKPDQGTVRIQGEDVTSWPPHRRGVGMVFQSYALFPHLSVAENIAYPLKLRGVAPRERRERVEGALAMVRMEGLGERSVGSLSGGQRQRVALARAIVFRPHVLLMDEPLSALDKPLRDAMQIELRRLHAELGITVIYVTHDQREALSLSDRIAVMGEGEIVQIGVPADVYDRPKDSFVASFLGEANLLPVERSGGSVAFEGRPVWVGGGCPPDASLLMIRPEQLVLSDVSGEVQGRNSFDGRVEYVIAQGESRLVTVRLVSGRTLLFRQSVAEGSELPQQGAQIRLSADRRHCVLVPAAGALSP